MNARYKKCILQKTLGGGLSSWSEIQNMGKYSFYNFVWDDFSKITVFQLPASQSFYGYHVM